MSDAENNDVVHEPHAVDEQDGHPVETSESHEQGARVDDSPYAGMDKSMGWAKGGAILLGALGLGSLGLGGLSILDHMHHDKTHVTAASPSPSSSTSAMTNPVPRSGTSSSRSSASSTSSAAATPTSSAGSSSPASSSTQTASPSHSATSIPSPRSSSIPVPVPAPSSGGSSQGSGNSSSSDGRSSNGASSSLSGSVIPGPLSHAVGPFTQTGRRGTMYHIQPGDTLSQIAEAFGVPVDVLAKRNNVVDPNVIFANHWLIIPRH